MENRMISLERNTNETQIDLTLDLDGSGRYEIDTGCGFLNHMLELFARHGRFDLVLTCHGDVEVDYHHTTEDVGIALGQLLCKFLCFLHCHSICFCRRIVPAIICRFFLLTF